MKANWKALLYSVTCAMIFSGCGSHVKQTIDEIELGTEVDLVDYIECKEGFSVEVKKQDEFDTINIMKVGSYDIPFVVTDTNGKKTEEIFTFKVVDTTAPEIITEDKVVVIKGVTFDIEEHVEATDLSGDVTITASMEIDTEKAGDYPITVTVADASSNKATKDITVTVMERTETNFRNAVWGDSVSLIREIETAQETLDSTDEIMSFEGQVCGYDTSIAYFVDEAYGLYTGMYMFDLPSRPTSTLYIEDYQKVKENLIKVYGNPDFCGEPRVINDLAEFIDDADHSLLMGYMGYASEWEIPEKNMNIQLVLYGEAFQMHLVAIYKDMNYVDTRDYTEGL